MKANRNLIRTSLLCAILLAWIAAKAQPVITQQPTNQTAVFGGSASFNVAVSGTGPFSYQWQFNSTNLPENIITTIAGNGINGYTGDGGAAVSAELYPPNGIAVDGSGNLIVVGYNGSINKDNIRKVSINGIITTFAGNGTSGYTGDGGIATNAAFYIPSGVAVDRSHNVFIVDLGNARIRKVSTNGIITTYAGNGTYGYSGDGGPATNAEVNTPHGAAVDSGGNVFFADTYNYRIREVFTNGIITTVAGNGTAGNNGAGGAAIGNGGAATNADVNNPTGVAVDGSGNIFIVGDNNIRKVSTNGIITSIAGDSIFGYAGYYGDGGLAINSVLNNPNGVAVDNSGNVFFADTGNNRIREISVNGIITTVAGNGTLGYSGDGQAATNATLNDPNDVSVDANGNLFIADTGNNCIRKVSSLPSLVLNSISTNNIGNYSVIITSSSGSVTSSIASLTVLVPPSIVTQPTNQIVIVGSSAEFDVVASGLFLSYQWSSNSVNILKATNAMLILNGVQTNAAANYTVNVTNIAGSVTSSVASLIVAPTGYKQIVGLLLGGGKMSLSFVGLQGTNYALDRSFSLSPANWIPQVTNPADANGNLNFTNTPDPTTNNFWRIRSVP